uniref:Uncharacterized protein n=1 Tax=Timema tahoe TaxID=61484 RepID=A0A7R9II21_9NEOP|nr:unnamed protein product [Timema tahoe]
MFLFDAAGSTVGFQYVVMVSPGRSINMSAIKEYRANNPPIILNNMNSDTIYSIAVVLETEEGFRSLLSEVESVEVQAASWAAVLTTSNLVSVVVPVILVVIVLVAALGFFIFRHRRLQRSFVSFANSHYDTRSGATTFSGGDGLDEEDSPVIRGFSDDEPLVIA